MPVDFGEINGNEITIKLGLDKVNAAVGANVLGTTSTNTQAEAQILIGSSLTGGLLLNSDNGTGSSFNISGGGTNPTPTPTPDATPTPTPTRRAHTDTDVHAHAGADSHTGPGGWTIR